MNSPFKFLSAYNAEDVDQFFGRDEEVKTLYEMVFKTKLVLVYGLSGTGKTSLIQCGLASRFDDSEWYPFWVRRHNNINESLDKSLNLALRGDSSQSVVDRIRVINEKYYRPVYLIFDQFEELFILGDKSEQQKCVATIKSILEANLQCKIILIMREEYIGRIYPYEATVPALFKHRFRIEQMGPAQIKTIIEKSFDAFNVKVEKPADESINMILERLSDSNNEISLPYLQVYLDILYRNQYKKTIGDKEVKEKYPKLPVSQKDISEMGDIEDVLDKFLEEQQTQLYKQLKSVHSEIDEKSIPGLLDVFVTEEGTKRPIQIKRDKKKFTIINDGNFTLPVLGEEVIQAIIEKLSKSRILRFEDDGVELAHDSLALLLEQRRSDEQRELHQLRKRIQNGFQEYQDSGTYLNQRQLDTFLHLLPSLNLSEDISYFIDASKKDAEAKLNQELIRQKKELEAEQKIKHADLLEGKLAAEKKAHSRSKLASWITGIAVPLLLWFGWNTNESRKKANEQNTLLKEEKQTVDSLFSESEKEKAAMSELLDELNNVKILIDTLHSIGITDSILLGRLSEASNSIEEVKENSEIKEIIEEANTSVNTLLTHLKGNKTPRKTFKAGSVVGFEAFLNLPKGSEAISWKWIGPDGKAIKEKTATMGRNTSEKGGRLFDFKGVPTPGSYSIQIFDENMKMIDDIKIDVE